MTLKCINKKAIWTFLWLHRAGYIIQPVSRPCRMDYMRVNTDRWNSDINKAIYRSLAKFSQIEIVSYIVFPNYSDNVKKVWYRFNWTLHPNCIRICLKLKVLLFQLLFYLYMNMNALKMKIFSLNIRRHWSNYQFIGSEFVYNGISPLNKNDLLFCCWTIAVAISHE